MQIVKPNAEIRWITPNILQQIESAGRTCYKSENNITEDSSKRFIANLIKRGHESVLEHGVISVKITCDRGILAELTRHRIASYSVESTRYVNYQEGITVIEPCFWEEDKKNTDTDLDDKYQCWLRTIEFIEQSYKMLIKFGATPEEARTILPNSLKTEIVVTTNIRIWRHILKLRSGQGVHPQFIEIVRLLLKKFNKVLPEIFGDIIDEQRT